MKKRIAALLLMLTLCVSLTAPAFALTWDTDRDSWGDSVVLPSTEEWRAIVDIEGLYETGYVDHDKSGLAATVCYCSDSAKVKLLKDADVMHLGNSVCRVSVTDNGEIIKGDLVEPTWQNGVYNSEYETTCNGAGTYWELTEGVYYMGSVVGAQILYIVVGDPFGDNDIDDEEHFTVTAEDGQEFYLSAAPLGSYTYKYLSGSDDTETVEKIAVQHYVMPEMTITLPADADRSYELFAVQSGGDDEVIKTINPGQTVKFSELRAESGKSCCVYVYGGAEVRGELQFSILYKQELFSDVSSTEYYYTPMSWALANGITDGVGDSKFAPNNECTRAQVVTFLWRAAGEPEAKTNVSFSDVSSKEYYYKAVQWAVENKITTGVGDGKFAPNDTCTRSQVVTFLWRANGSKIVSGGGFSDVPADAYYGSAVKWAVANGITTGMGDGKFAPDDTCTRGQVVTFLFRAQ